MARMIIKREGTIDVDAGKAADVIAAAAVGAVVSRQHDGQDVNDRAFKAYSVSYLAQLLREGEATNVDHRRTGLMLSQVAEVQRRPMGTGRVRVTIGIGSAGNRNLIGAYLQRLRKWFGLSPSDRKEVRAALAKAKGVVRRKPGTSTTIKGGG